MHIIGSDPDTNSFGLAREGKGREKRTSWMIFVGEGTDGEGAAARSLRLREARG